MPRHFRIHPAIGVARLGNSTDSDGFFIGPEIPGIPGNWNHKENAFDKFRDAQGRVKRQAARFRVFEYVAGPDGKLSQATEVLLNDEIVDIEWRVHLANRKASFFTFDGQRGANDLYVGRSGQGEVASEAPGPWRNAEIPEAEREGRLDIDSKEQLISQKLPGPVELFNTNSAIPISSLGQLRLDGARLIALGGYGQSASTENPPRKLSHYANNDTWFDDASDGSVKARIIFKDGSTQDADPAWLLVGPPDFAPGAVNAVTLYDTLWDTAVRELAPGSSDLVTPVGQLLEEQRSAWRANNGKSLSGFEPSFVRDIYPILKRALQVRKVHSPGEADKDYHLRLLAWDELSSLSVGENQAVTERRNFIFGWIRDPESSVVDWKGMPRGLGDEYDEKALEAGNPSPRSFLSFSRIQYAILTEWNNNHFKPGWSGEPVVPALRQPAPDDLDRAATEACVGGPFFPGIEVSWLIRAPQLFSEPFRLKVPAQPESEIAHVPEFQVGALRLRPGFFSQQMAVPWQADFIDCQKESFTSPEDDQKYFYMWWTSQRPDDVMPSGATEQVDWVRKFDSGIEDDSGDPDDRFKQMQQRWHELRFVVDKGGGRVEEEE